MLKNKNAVITGATEGIGLSIAKMFAQNGANVCLVARNYDRLLEVQTELSIYGTNVHIISADLSSDYKQVAQGVQKIYSSVDVLVNNAGIAKFKAFEDVEVEDLDSQLNLNVKAPFYLTQQLLSSLEKSGASVINISSYFSQRMLQGRNSSVYSATKGAINSLTKALAFELGKKGVRVNAIAPGSINTKLFQSNLEYLSPIEKDAFQNMVTQIYPLGKIGEPEDIAHMAVFLASDQAKWITGSIISVDGGLTTN